MITLVMGGTRSGKSAVAEQLARESGTPVTYLATGGCADGVDSGDADMAARIAAHRQRRPADWATVEELYAVAEALEKIEGTVLLDSLGSWLAADIENADVDALVGALLSRSGDTIVVSEEVGMSVHPPTPVGRRFADRLGELNSRVAEIADRCLFVVAGRVMELPPRHGDEMRSPSPLHAPAGEQRRAGLRGLWGLRGALSFLTTIGGAAPPDARSLDWFPLVGAGVGLALGALWWGALDIFPVLPAAALVVAGDLLLTGALHLDGLADSSDGLLSHLPRHRRLEVMTDPHVGTFGIAAVVMALVLRATALASFATARPLLLAAVWCASRTSMAIAARVLPYARGHGLATPFLEGSFGFVALSGTLIALGLAVIDGAGSVAAVASVGVVSIGVHALAYRRLGGFTGDTLGASCVVAETVALLVAAAVVPGVMSQ